LSVGEKVRMLREKRELSQSDLAKAVGYKTRSSIAKIESGSNNPSQKMLLKLAGALDASPADLIDEKSYFAVEVSDKKKAIINDVLQIPDGKIDLLSSIVRSILEDARKES